ncbi:MAG: hypothetical protein U0Z44_22040 [Kouleothrix sp.]
MNLDDAARVRAERRVCWHHGGSQYAGKYGIDGTPTPALNTQFLPYDLDNYEFSTLVGFPAPEQEAQLLPICWCWR